MEYVPTQEDNKLLQKAFKKVIALKRFREVNTEVKWGIPPAVNPIELPSYDYVIEPESSDEQILNESLQAVKDGDWETAISRLSVLADKGHGESLDLLIRILLRLDRDWQKWAKKRNNLANSYVSAPLGCRIVHSDGSSIILVHPILCRNDVPPPLYVISYIIHHELLHETLNTSDDNPHPEEFKQIESEYPNTNRALAWLSKHGYMG